MVNDLEFHKRSSREGFWLGLFAFAETLPEVIVNRFSTCADPHEEEPFQGIDVEIHQVQCSSVACINIAWIKLLMFISFFCCDQTIHHVRQQFKIPLL